MSGATHCVKLTSAADHATMRFRGFNLMPCTSFIPFADVAGLHRHYRPLGAQVARPAIGDPAPAAEDEKSSRSWERQDCDFSMLSQRLVVFFRWRGADAAEDLAQETLQRGLSKMDAGLELYSPPVHYFFAIAKNVLRESRRKSVRDPHCIGVDLDTFSDWASTDTRADHAALLEECLSTLSKDDRHVVVRYYEGERDKLTGELGVDANALRVRVHRAVRRMRARLAAASDSKSSKSQAATRPTVEGPFQVAPAAGACSRRRFMEDSNAMSYSTRNTGKQWTNNEKSQLRQLAMENTPTRVIGLKLGRTPEAVYSQASKQGTSLGPDQPVPVQPS